MASATTRAVFAHPGEDDTSTTELKAGLEKLLPSSQKDPAQPPLGTDDHGSAHKTHSATAAAATTAQEQRGGKTGLIQPLQQTNGWQMAPVKPETLKHRAKR